MGLINQLQTDMPPWSNHIIRCWEDDFESFNDFSHGMLKLEINSIDVTTIVGQRDHYCGETWYDAINGKHINHDYKMLRNISHHDNNPLYYFDANTKDDWSLLTFDNKSWYSDEGNHRTIIAKFAFHVSQQHGLLHSNLLQGIKLFKASIDMEAHRLFNECKDLIREEGLNVHIDGPIKDRYTQWEPRIRWYDERYPRKHRRRGGFFNMDEFKEFASEFLRDDGRIRLRDKLLSFFT